MALEKDVTSVGQHRAGFMRSIASLWYHEISWYVCITILPVSEVLLYGQLVSSSLDDAWVWGGGCTSALQLEGAGEPSGFPGLSLSG